MTTYVLPDATYDRLVADLAALQVAAFPGLDPAHVDSDQIKLALADRAGIYAARVTADPGFDHNESGEAQERPLMSV